jgi:hypothetical protein
VYTYQINNKPIKIQRLSLFFNQGRLVRME